MNAAPLDFDLLVLGGGAAGLTAALVATARGAHFRADFPRQAPASPLAWCSAVDNPRRWSRSP